LFLAFAQLAGRVEMYNYLPNDLKQGIHEILLADIELGMVVKDYYKDNGLCRDKRGNIHYCIKPITGI
jgi:hypothetical protein